MASCVKDKKIKNKNLKNKLYELNKLKIQIIFINLNKTWCKLNMEWIRNSKVVKHCLDFSFVLLALLPAWRNLFSASGRSLTCSKKPVFSKRDLPWWKIPTKLYCASDERKVPASFVTISRKWKIPTLRYVGKGPEYTGLSCDFHLVPSAEWSWAQIWNHRRSSTQALFIYITCIDKIKNGFWEFYLYYSTKSFKSSTSFNFFLVN